MRRVTRKKSACNRSRSSSSCKAWCGDGGDVNGGSGGGGGGGGAVMVIIVLRLLFVGSLSSPCGRDHAQN